MPADVIEFRASQRRFAAAFARYDLLALMKAALEDLGEELDAANSDEHRTTLARDFHEQWVAYCDSDISQAEIAKTRERIAGLRDEIRPLILSVVAIHEAGIIAGRTD